MNESNALRLADWCDAHSSGVYRPSAEAAAELRRLSALNAELLEALRWFAACVEGSELYNVAGPHVERARAALAKATP
jgi:hypothetical protein